MVQYCVRLDKIWFFPLVWDYDRYVREAFDIGEDGTGKHWNCAIDFIRLWVLFMFLLIPYFRMLDDIGKTSSLFSRPCSTALWSPRLFLLSTDFLAQFWHDEMSCSHRTHTWLNVKHHPPMVDQISHVGIYKKPRPFNHIFGGDRILRAWYRGIKNSGPRKRAQGRAQDIPYQSISPYYHRI